MKKRKRGCIEKAGWKVGPGTEFLRLSAEGEVLLDLKVALAESLRKRRLERHLTQGALAKLLQSSQSRVAKMEASDPTVSLDLLVPFSPSERHPRSWQGLFVGLPAPVRAGATAKSGSSLERECTSPLVEERKAESKA